MPITSQLNRRRRRPILFLDFTAIRRNSRDVGGGIRGRVRVIESVPEPCLSMSCQRLADAVGDATWHFLRLRHWPPAKPRRSRVFWCRSRPRARSATLSTGTMFRNSGIEHPWCVFYSTRPCESASSRSSRCTYRCVVELIAQRSDGLPSRNFDFPFSPRRGNNPGMG